MFNRYVGIYRRNALRWYREYRKWQDAANRYYHNWKDAARKATRNERRRKSVESQLRRVKEKLEACRHAAQVPGEPGELPPCAQADIDYENVLGQWGKLGDAIDSLENIREDVYELKPEADAQNAYNSLNDVMTSIDRVYDTLKSAYQKYPGI